MWAWVAAAVTAGLWFWVGRLAWDVMMRTGRGIESGKISQQVNEMFGTQDEIEQRMNNAPNDPAPAIKYTMMAGDNWAEMKLRAGNVVRRFPSTLHGDALLARALWELGEKDEARRVTRRAVHRYPGDVATRLFAAEQALDAGDHRTAFRHTRAIRKEFPEVVWSYVAEANTLIDLKKYLKAEALLNKADTYLPDNEHLDKVWARLQQEAKSPAG